MRINEIIWLDAIVDKLARKHGVDVDEAEEVFDSKPQFRFVEKGDRAGEDVYMASGQTNGGRYLTVLFIRKANGDALILSARDMANWERKRYERK
ncbi:MAG: BrnT family toxin [Acidobacteria bacterium]|nr:BrnT family toxin [Acidobacteriota bacterium]